MTVNISIIGLGFEGVSLSLALARSSGANFVVHGYDPSQDRGRKSVQHGAFARLFWNLPQAADDADLVVLAQPLSEIKATLDTIAPVLKDGAVVTDLAALKQPVLDWAAAVVPSGRYYIAGRPVLNPAVLHSGETDPAYARADLFDDSLWAIVPTPAPPEAATKLVADLARVAGATPFFVDATEHDALTSALETLPTLFAATLLQQVIGAPDWSEGRKLAGRTFASSTVAALLTNPADISVVADYSRDTLLPLLAAARDQLAAVYDALHDGDTAAVERLLNATAEARAQWLTERKANDWAAEEALEVEVISGSERMQQAIGGKLLREALQKAEGDNPLDSSKP